MTGDAEIDIEMAGRPARAWYDELHRHHYTDESESATLDVTISPR